MKQKIINHFSGKFNSFFNKYLPSKGDISDFIAKFNDKEQAAERLSILIDNAGPYEPPKKVTIEDIILPANQFYQLDVPERQELLFPWLKEDSINLVSGWRGCGKTWFALGVLNAVSKGTKFGPWECKKSVPCLFLDGEMTVTDDHERIKNLRLDSDRENPFYFYSDAYANQLGLPRAHLAKESWRQKMKQILITRKVKLWVVDNLASLASGLDENKKQDWDPINSWLLELRFAGISTIMLHHTNKDGGQRGTSAREDNLDISMMLKKPHDYMPEDGARFIAHFGKARVQTSRLNLISDTEFKLIVDESGSYVWTFNSVKKETKNEILRLLDEGMTQTDVKSTLGIDKAYVSRIRKQAIKDGLLTPKNKLTQSGFMSLNG
ncbi:MAG: AAA family ATPase [Thermodesulfobacteriota bacterium]|nr:AAA family ATPase [Thermodesulfobacteriota bacterium]